MSGISDRTIDVQRAAEAYREDPLVAAIVDHVASREREPKNAETRIRVMRKGLQLPRETTADELVAALDKLAAAGCGELRVGRPKEESRLLWRSGVSAIRIAEQIRREAGNSAKEGLDETSVLDEEHVFPVRPGVRMGLRIRSDMSADELDNLAEFVRVIARSKRS
jgi:hypothetical protein